jgi:hypothetical protein
MRRLPGVLFMSAAVRRARRCRRRSSSAPCGSGRYDEAVASGQAMQTNSTEVSNERNADRGAVPSRTAGAERLVLRAAAERAPVL